MEQAEIGVIGGSGLYQMPEFTDVQEVKVDTPFGEPSDVFVLGTLARRKVAFLPRHGKGHRFLPSDINYRANIYAFKKLGVKRIISATAVGSLKEELKPLDIVIPDQFFDRTRGRKSTFFEKGIAVHVAFAEPVCPEVLEVLYQAGVSRGYRIHKGGCYLCMEGPQFSTKAESMIYRSWGLDIIGMTNLQEAKLAREAEICYATMAFVTDYDCWHEEEESVSVGMLIERLEKNAQTAREMIVRTVRGMPTERACSCGQALKNAILTDPRRIPSELKKDLEPIIGKYIPAS
jgi:5'-methylthioadenosine phosphorylase